jgi:hypothetical protein
MLIYIFPSLCNSRSVATSFEKKREISRDRSFPGGGSGVHRNLRAAVAESSDLSRRRPLHRGLPTAPSHRALLLLAGVAVVFVPPILLSAGDQLGAVARLRGAAGVAAAGGQPRRLLPPGSQRTGEFLPPVELLPML